MSIRRFFLFVLVYLFLFVFQVRSPALLAELFSLRELAHIDPLVFVSSLLVFVFLRQPFALFAVVLLLPLAFVLLPLLLDFLLRVFLHFLDQDDFYICLRTI